MILVVANDKRMTYVADELSAFFNVVRFNNEKDLKDFNFSTVAYAIFPFKIDAIAMRDLVAKLSSDCIIFTPIMRDFLVGVQQPVEVIMDYDEIAIYNSIPTAEGTILYIMQNTETTIHGTRIHVIGAGRCGETLAKSLRALGAHVSISTRNPSLAARMFESGIPVVTDLESLPKAEVVVNTIPALILDGNLLKLLKQDVYVADIASAPGGVDFEAAVELGIKAELLPALPGIVAPKTAASYLAQFIKRTIDTNGRKRGFKNE